MKRQLLSFMGFLCSLTLLANTFNVVEFGAKGDGGTLDTEAIQKAINACTAFGGGTVLFPSQRTFLTGTIYLKDNVTLKIENGAVLKGSPNMEDYATDTHKQMYKNETHMDRCLIYAKGASSFSITGKGSIDGNGYQNYFHKETIRPMLIRFVECSDITIRDITLVNPASWVSAWLYCDQIVVDGIRIHSRVNGNGDGLDFDGCTNVRVSNSSFDTSDDSICLQASRQDKPCKNVVITNCTFTSKWAGMRIGLLSRGDFESVTVSNCTFYDIMDSGLKIQMNEGGTMKNMVFSNLVMKNVPRPVFMTLCQQRACVDAPEEMYPMGRMENFIFKGIVVDNRELDKNSAIFLTGMPGHYIKDISFSDIQLHFSGGGRQADAERLDLPEYSLETLQGWWPEFHLVGTLPASGIYARHIDGLSLHHIAIHTEVDEVRRPIILEDVKDPLWEAITYNNQRMKDVDVELR